MVSFAHTLLLGSIAGAGAACATTRTLEPMTIDAPLDFVAWICADTCRVQFPGADPLPYHAGAPVTRLPDGSYEVCYLQRDDGRWTARAEGRLQLPMRASSELPRSGTYTPAAGLIGWRSSTAEVVVHIERQQGGVVVRTALRGVAADELERHLLDGTRFAGALAHATDPELRPCCSHHAPWRATVLLRNADRAAGSGDLLTARDCLRAALAQAPRLPDLDYRIGELDRALGQDELAIPRLRTASRRTADPGRRSTAAAAARASAERSTTATGRTLRNAALAQLANGQIESAAALAHAARAADPDPVADLRLRHRLQRLRHDDFGSLGTALLLREYAQDPEVDRLLAEDFGNVGHWQLAQRATARALLGQMPRALIEQLQTTSQTLAQRAIERWTKARNALAAPPK